MRKILLSAALAAAACLSATAQRSLTDIARSITPGGYIIGQYTASDADDAAATDKGFGIRLLRLYVNGSMFDDFKYRVQLEASGTPGSAASMRLLDAYGEWTKYKGFQIKAGQMKRCFSFENPMNPWDVGFGSYSQAILKLTGFSDRVGEHSSNGRDAGLVIQGDLFPFKQWRFLHYQVGVYNGQGTNQRDKNHRRDVMGGLWVNPIKGLSVGAFGWDGNYVNGTQTYSRTRLAYGFQYEGDLQFRGEYLSSVGGAPSKTYKDADGKDLTHFMSDKADGWYIMAGAPIVKGLRAQVKWDVYREEKSHATQSTKWSIGLDYWFAKNLKIQLTYDFNELEKDFAKFNSITDRHYNTADLQLYIRF